MRQAEPYITYSYKSQPYLMCHKPLCVCVCVGGGGGGGGGGYFLFQIL